ncbi:hypothetical protein [Streptomyces marispadix]|uniref:DoxX family protein n=1 Tax=Streptomyces marispadix TaxID=2922868 RepID=A0ABS9SXF3_9ACTN|nr:hypothetical protein [Streptomyces marispadix]MCH6160883.1 hypothetical protein [Streptomyces marispadix]
MRAMKRTAGQDKAGQDGAGQRKAGGGKAGPRLITALRLVLFVVFAGYGTIKLLGGQYDYGDWTISNRTPDGTSVVWAFYGYSEVYGRFTGLYELVPALMLLSRRTVTLGAMALFAVSLNITVMDFAYGYPSVKYFSLAYTLLCLVLVVHGRERLIAAFWERPGAETPEGR